MKLAFSTLGCPSMTLPEVLACAVRGGYSAVEIRLDRDNRLFGYSEDRLGEAKRLLSKAGVEVTDLGTGLTFLGTEGEHLEAVEACARLAAAVGATALRVFAGAHVSVPSEISEENIRTVAASLSACASVAERYGVELWVETHSAYSTGKSVGDLMRAVDRRSVRVIWDIMHSIEFGESPAETVRFCGAWIAHVHLKDGVPLSGAEDAHYTLTALGAGAVDFSEIAQALRRIGYGGALSLEWELAWHPELSSCYADTDALLLAYRQLVQKHFYGL